VPRLHIGDEKFQVTTTSVLVCQSDPTAVSLVKWDEWT